MLVEFAVDSDMQKKSARAKDSSIRDSLMIKSARNSGTDGRVGRVRERAPTFGPLFSSLNSFGSQELKGKSGNF